jgi:hypothetical protein
MDSRKGIPDGPFDVFIWSPSIFSYTAADVDVLMARIKEAGTKNAVLCGFTAVEIDRPSPEVLWHDLNSLANRLKRYFANVQAFERVHTTIQPPRHALYFFATDGVLPFEPEWKHGVRL